MPLTLKEDMTTICDQFQINESDLMRKAIVQFVENVKRNPDQHSRYMFVWGNTRISLGFDIPKRPCFPSIQGLFSSLRKNLKKVQIKVLEWWCKSAIQRPKTSPYPSQFLPFHRFSAIITKWTDCSILSCPSSRKIPYCLLILIREWNLYWLLCWWSLSAGTFRPTQGRPKNAQLPCYVGASLRLSTCQ